MTLAYPHLILRREREAPRSARGAVVQVQHSGGRGQSEDPRGGARPTSPDRRGIRRAELGHHRLEEDGQGRNGWRPSTKTSCRRSPNRARSIWRDGGLLEAISVTTRSKPGIGATTTPSSGAPTTAWILRGGQLFPLGRCSGHVRSRAGDVGLEFREVPDPDVWHPDVRLFAIHDAEAATGSLTFYLDLPSRGQVRARRRVPLIMSRRLEDGSCGPVCAMVADQADRDGSFLAPARRGRDPLFQFGHVLHQNLVGPSWLGSPEPASSRTSSRRRARSCSTGCGATSSVVSPGITRRATRSRSARRATRRCRQLNVSIHQLRQLQYGWWDQTMHGSDPEIDLDVVLRRSALGLIPFHEAPLPWRRSAISWAVTTPHYGYMWSGVRRRHVLAVRG